MENKINKLREFGNVVIIIDEENSILASLIKDNFIYNLRKRKTNFEVINLTIEEGEFLIKEFQLSEFPSVLYFKNRKLINRINGFSYFNQKIKETA